MDLTRGSKSFSRTIKSAHVGSGGRPRSFTNSSSRKAILNRPGFTGECFVQILGCFIMAAHAFIETLLCLLWRCVANGAVQALGVIPTDPPQGFPLDLAD